MEFSAKLVLWEGTPSSAILLTLPVVTYVPQVDITTRTISLTARSVLLGNFRVLIEHIVLIVLLENILITMKSV
jgi:hypothetical protein